MIRLRVTLPHTRISPRDRILFQRNHFWRRHLYCYLSGTLDDFLNSTADDLNGHLTSSGVPVPFFQYQYVYQGKIILYKGLNLQGVPLLGNDLMVNDAYIPDLPNCP